MSNILEFLPLKKLNHILQYRNLHIECYAVFLSIISLFEPLCLIVLCLYLYLLRYRIRWYFFGIMMLSIMMLFIIATPPKKGTNIEGIGRVVDIDETLYQDMVTIKIDYKKYHLYVSKGSMSLGDSYVIRGKLETYRKQTTPYGFNAYSYYLSQGIKGFVIVDSKEFLDHGFSFYHLRQQFKSLLETYKSSPYMTLFFLGKTDKEHTFYEMYHEIGLIFLLSASGLHIYVLIFGLKKCMNVWSVKQGYQDLASLLLLGLFLYLNAFQLGTQRLFIFYLMSAFFRHQKIHIQKLDILQITFFLIVVFNISGIYSSTLLILYVLFNVLYLMEPLLSQFNGYFKHVMIAFICQLILLPFFNETSILLILLMPIFTLFFSKIYSFLLCSILVFRPFDGLFMKLMDRFNFFLSMIFSKELSIVIPSLSLLTGMIYIYFLVCFLKSKSIINRMTHMMLIFLFVLLLSLYHEYRTSIMFLDVGQGDSTIITHEGCVIVIDAYGNVTDTLKSLNLNSIDYLILTHADLDHTREAENIISKTHVKKLVLSAYGDYQPYQMPTSYVKAHDVITCKSLNINILGPLKSYDNENNQSIVLQFRLGHQTFLFTGDIEKEAEFDLASFYQEKLKSDVLKIAHHGSITSSTDMFLSYVFPKIAIISLGYHNKFDFPHDDVLDRLNKYRTKIYRTDYDGTIMFLPSRKKEKWITYIPY